MLSTVSEYSVRSKHLDVNTRGARSGGGKGGWNIKLFTDICTPYGYQRKARKLLGRVINTPLLVRPRSDLLSRLGLALGDLFCSIKIE